MKKIYKNISWAGIISILTIFNSSYCQTSQFHFSYNLPARFHYHREDTRPPYLENTTREDYGAAHDSGTFVISKKVFYPGADISFIIPLSQQPSPSIQYSVHFVIDSLQQTLKNISINFQYSYYASSANVQITSGVLFIGLPSEFTDSTIIVDAIGKICKSSLQSANNNSSDYENISQYHTYESHDLDSLLEDTSSYQFSLRVSPISEVSFVESYFENLFFAIHITLSDHSINFTFPYSNHPQPLLIYDLLGREVKRIEIPSGVSEYSLPEGQLPSGCYFARLGNMGAKFMVW